MFPTCIYNTVNECWNMESVTYCIIDTGMKTYHTLSNSPKSSLNFFSKIIPSKKHTLTNYPCIKSIHIFFKEAPELTTNPTLSNNQSIM